MHLAQNGSGKDSRDFLGALALSVGHTFVYLVWPSCSAELALLCVALHQSVSRIKVFLMGALSCV